MRIFGAEAYALVPKQLRSKLDNHSLIFVEASDSGKPPETAPVESDYLDLDLDEPEQNMSMSMSLLVMIQRMTMASKKTRQMRLASRTLGLDKAQDRQHSLAIQVVSQTGLVHGGGPLDPETAAAAIIEKPQISTRSSRSHRSSRPMRRQ